MYLKEMTVFGFKSFADKTVITLEPGLTGVVGPNGSGKSNIYDCVRWALGEQSQKSLRTPSSEDIIFQGSRKRERLGLSHVALTFSTEDEEGGGEEFVVSRKFYRSGENEYTLNGVKARLKDIRKLMYDHGFSLDNLSIIGQGEVDRILNASDTERRELIEEVSGIAPFRDNKRRTLSRLDKTNQNLERVQDMLDEHARQMEHLKEQRDDAEKHAELSAQRSETRSLLLRSDAAANRKNTERVTKELSDSRAELEKAGGAKEKLAARLLELRAAGRERLEAKEQALNALHALRREIETLKGRLDLVAQKEEGYGEIRARAQREMGEIDHEIVQAEKEIRELTERIERVVEEKQAVEGDKGALDKEHAAKLEGVRALEQKEAEAREELGLSRLEAQDNRNLTENIARDLKNVARDMEALGGRVESSAKDVDELTAGVKRAEADVEKLKKQRAGREKDLGEMERGVTEARSAVGEAREKLEKLTEGLHRSREAEKVLSELEDSFEGYLRGPKTVLKAAKKGELKGIIGDVSSLIKVEPKFAPALDALYGQALQSIVVETEADALAAIEFLKKGRAGRATFYPLDMLKPPPAHRDIPARLHLGYVEDLIECDKRIRPVVLALVRDDMVAEDMKSAGAIHKKHAQHGRIVTLDGDVLYPEGRMFGGHREAQRTGVLSRKVQLDELGKGIIKNERDAEKAVKALEDARAERDRRISELDKARSEIKDADTEIVRAQAEAGRRTQSLEELSGRRSAWQAEIAKLEKLTGDLKERAREAGKREGELASRGKELEEKLAVAETAVSEAREVLEISLTKLSQQQVLVASLEKERGDLAQRKASLENRLKAFHARGEGISKELETRRDELSTLKEQRTEVRENLEKLEAGLPAREKDLADAQKALTEFNESLEKTEIDLEKAEERIDELTSAIHSAELKEVRLTAQAEELEKDSAELHIDLMEEVPKGTPSRKDLRDTLSDLEESIELLGEINPLARRDYDEVARKKEFLEENRADLEKAKQDLLDSLDEIERESTTRFEQAFGLMKQSFNECITEVFGPEAYGDLVLTDVDNVLESGVEIRVKPPGKKEADLIVFSGGEKALVGLALLFAVLKTMDNKLVFLDEVEVALDDINVGKYVSLLKNYSSGRQFLVITHNKLTMEAADRLYGVTMVEQGVTRVVSVNLRKYDNGDVEAVEDKPDKQEKATG